MLHRSCLSVRPSTHRWILELLSGEGVWAAFVCPGKTSGWSIFRWDRMIARQKVLSVRNRSTDHNWLLQSVGFICSNFCWGGFVELCGSCRDKHFPNRLVTYVSVESVFHWAGKIMLLQKHQPYKSSQKTQRQYLFDFSSPITAKQSNFSEVK